MKQRRKVANPLLILVQAELFGKTEEGREACLDDLEEQYEAVLKQSKPNGIARQDSDRTPTNDQEDTDLIQSADALSLQSLPSSRKRSFDSSVSLSRKNSYVCGSYSSSYTSCTQPLAGQRLSDSRVPNSSILDTGPEAAPELLHSRRSNKSWIFLQRKGSEDTSKDISDMEDWDIDECEPLDDMELLSDDHKHKSEVDQAYEENKNSDKIS